MGVRLAAFIDRDGTINSEVDNLSKIKDLAILPKVPQAIGLLNKFNIPTIVITNQPVVARGLLTEEEVKKVHKEISNRLGRDGVKIDGFYFCPHHPQANLKKYRITCLCRKPGIAMYQQAASDFKIDLTKSYVIGDSFRDIEAGKTLNVITIAITSGQKNFKNSKPDYQVQDLYAAVKLILRREKLK